MKYTVILCDYIWQQLSDRAYECELCHRCGEKDTSMNIFSHMIHAKYEWMDGNMLCCKSW